MYIYIYIYIYIVIYETRCATIDNSNSKDGDYT